MTPTGTEARAADPDKKHGHYYKSVGHLEAIDVYRVIDLFEVTHPALQHALKKVIAAGKRGAKSQEQDAKEAIDSIQRFLDMQVEDRKSDIKADPCGGEFKEAPYVPSDHVVEPPADPEDPHAELRKAWRPGQRWQARASRSGKWGPWVNVIASEPFWLPSQDYRRHPDDTDEK